MHRLRFTGFYFGKFLRINTLLVFCAFRVRGIYWTEGKTGGRRGAAANTHRVFFLQPFVADLRFPLMGKPTPHILCYPAFTFHKNWSRLSVSAVTLCQIKHLLSICITSLCLSTRLLEVLFSISLPPFHPPLGIWPLIAFSLLHKSPPLAQKLCSCGSPVAGTLMQVGIKRRNHEIYPPRHRIQPRGRLQKSGQLHFQELTVSLV